MVFNSERELDTFLKANVDRYKINTIHKTFSTDPQVSTLNILENEMKFESKGTTQEKINVGLNEGDDIEVEVVDKVPMSISTTKLLATAGKMGNWSEPIAVPFNVTNYKNREIDRLVQSGIDKTAATKQLDLTIKSWEQQTEIGTEIHKLFETILNKEEFKGKFLSEEQANSLTTWFNDYLTQFKKEFGEKSQFFTEFSVKSKGLAYDLQKALNADFVNGRIDLLAIDERGRAHIFDFKISKRAPGVWAEMNNSKLGDYYHSTKKRTISHQMGVYRRIFDQHNVEVAKTQILPIKVDFTYAEDGITINGIDNIETPDNDTLKTVRDTENKLPNVMNNLSVMLPSIAYKGGNDAQWMIDTNNLHKAMFADNSGTRREVNIESQLNAMRNNRKYTGMYTMGTKAYENGFRYWVKSEGGITLECRTSEERDERLLTIITSQALNSQSQYLHVAKRLQSRINGDADTKLLDLTDDDERETWLQLRLKKYIDNKWNFIQNDDLNAEGIFVFKKWGHCEIIGLTDMNLSRSNKFAKGSSLMGMFLEDGKVEDEILPATNGNILLMRIMSMLQSNPDAFKGTRIDNIQVFNPMMQRGTGLIPTEWILSNYRRLFKALERTNDFNFKYNPAFEVYISDALHSIYNITQGLLEVGTDGGVINFDGEMIFNAENKAEAIEYVKSAFKQAVSKMYKANMQNTPESNEWQIVAYLSTLVSILQGNGYYKEDDRKNWGLNHSLRMTSPELSPSKNMRIHSKIINAYGNKVRDLTSPILRKGEVLFGKANRKIQPLKIIGGEGNWWINCFEKNSDGTLNENMTLKAPSDPFYIGKPEIKAAVEYFLEEINKLRYPKEFERDEKREQIGGEYYEVPLMPAKFNRQLKTTIKNGDWAKGWDIFKKKVDDITNQWTGVFRYDEGQTSVNESDWRKLRVRNPFNLKSSRQSIINEYGTGAFETDIESIFREAIQSYIEEKTAPNYLFSNEVLLFWRSLDKYLGGEDTPMNDKAIDDLIQAVMLGNPIMDKSLQPLHKVMGMLRGITSFSALAVNFRATFREGLQGMIMNMSRSFGGALNDMIDTNNMLKAYTELAVDSVKNSKKVMMYQALFYDMGLYESSINDIAEHFKENQLGILNLGQREAFFTSRIADFANRGMIILAKMMKDGVVNAYEYVDEYQPYKYIFEKDGRFTIYNSGDTKNKLYWEQKALYEAMVEQFNNEGLKVNIGDPLPKAYTNNELMTIKNFSDLCYGHYDEQTKALMTRSFLGAMTMQFRTYALSTIERNFLSPGIYNMGKWETHKDEDGVEIYQVFKWETEEKLGRPEESFIRADELDAMFDSRTMAAQPHKIWKGIPFEGMLQSTLDIVKPLIRGDMDTLNAMWKDDFKRGQFILLMHDMPLLMLMGWLVQLMFGGDEVKDKSWLANWSYQILWGATQDGPVNLVLTSMLSDVNPPMWGQLAKMYKTTSEVFLGKRDVLDGLTASFGTLREVNTVYRRLQ